jgi:6-oxo-cyclohex-1-ene-carbonyl-CoA hydrolase
VPQGLLLVAPRRLEFQELPLPEPEPGRARVRVAGCGVCHTDLSFYTGEVRTRAPLPLVLGHEIAGIVEAAPDRPALVGRQVIVPAVIPCGTCPLCLAGRDNACPAQTMPGNDSHGGFATHALVPAAHLVPLPDDLRGHALADLSVIADAITTPYQALLRAGASAGDLVIIVGAGGIGTYALQIARAFGASVAAIDVDEEKCERAAVLGAAWTFNPRAADGRGIRKRLLEQADVPTSRWRILEMSGTRAGQELAWSLLGPASTIGVIGFTMDRPDIRLSNLMAFDATAFGSWGCSPRHYAAAARLVLEGKVVIEPFVERHALEAGPELLARIPAGAHPARRPVLVPVKGRHGMLDTLKDHRLVRDAAWTSIRYELKPARDRGGEPVPDLFNAWIWLDNPAQLNSYTTDALRELILAFREASSDRRVVAVILTGTGDRAFCTGGNTKEYAEYYAGRPQEYRQYMRLFNDLVTGILTCDKPVINRVNGIRVAGGQEIGMACDFSIASDLAKFGQAGPKHGSAPDGGSTDFLHLFVGIAHAMESCAVCELWSAYKAHRLGLLNGVVPVARRDGRVIPNPSVVTSRWANDEGQIVYGEFLQGGALEAAHAALKACVVDLAPLDAAVEGLATKLLYTMPECLIKTVESVRKKKLEHWQRNAETNRAWLALNMMTEARAGFRAFNEGPPGHREVDFIELRRRLARGEPWDDTMFREIDPRHDLICGCRR